MILGLGYCKNIEECKNEFVNDVRVVEDVKADIAEEYSTVQ